MVKIDRLRIFTGIVCAVLVTFAVTACGVGSHSTAVPSATSANAPSRPLSERARRFSVAFANARAVPIETKVTREAAKGARVFRIEQVAVFDPASHQTINVSRDQLKRTANGIVLFEGPAQLVLSKDAIVSPSKHFLYVFRRGSERDPDPSMHAERIR